MSLPPELAPPVPVVTIDGPSGSGKGTVGRLLARRLGWHLLDSGALYRLVAHAGALAGLASDDVPGHVQVAAQMNIDVEPDAGTADAGAGTADASVGTADAGAGERILLDGRDVAAALREEAAGAGASRVALWPEVRAVLLARQHAAARLPGLIADGRDMGTVVFPSAPLKIFLTASAAERAARRYKQLKQKDSGVSLAALSREIAERDRRDATRPVAPLVPAADALVLDSTHMDAVAVAERIMAQGRARGLWP